ncbi:hypothetical protein B566_EDAN012962 [Ephemera danica]|nr:hypothetical protein B566_EDAN012962 [Ephemera danica]
MITAAGESHSISLIFQISSMFFLALIAFLFVFFDANYFIRVIFTILFGRLFQSKKGPLDETTIYGICTTQDIDIFIRHMNNARYVREMDFARFHFYDRSGIYETITKMKGNALQGACNIRYRRTIPIFNFYKVNVVGVNVNEMMSKMLGPKVQKPKASDELLQWLESIETSSQRLRKSKD